MFILRYDLYLLHFKIKCLILLKYVNINLYYKNINYLAFYYLNFDKTLF
jgi:hypothetical protein